MTSLNVCPTCMRSFSRPSTLIRHIQMMRCIPPYTEEVEHDNNEYMETSTSSSGDSHDVSHAERNEDNQETSSHTPTLGCMLVPILHGLTHTQLLIEDLGSPGKFNGSCLESMLKEFIKPPGPRTRKFHA